MGKKMFRLEVEIDFVPNDERDLTVLQWMMADTVQAIFSQFGKLIRVSRGWKELEEDG